MPRIAGVRERRQQPIWDSLIRTTGDPTTALGSSTRLFVNTNLGNLGVTNMQVAGQLASDQTYLVLAMRAYLFFAGTNSFTNYIEVASQLYFTLTAGDKPQFTAPCWYHPAGGGIWGGAGTANPVYSNGDPSTAALAKLARPIVLPVRQNFYCQAEFFTIGATSALTLLNTGATNDQKSIMYMIDGLQTRDVQ